VIFVQYRPLEPYGDAVGFQFQFPALGDFGQPGVFAIGIVGGIIERVGAIRVSDHVLDVARLGVRKFHLDFSFRRLFLADVRPLAACRTWLWLNWRAGLFWLRINRLGRLGLWHSSPERVSTNCLSCDLYVGGGVME
jgi:hypothetical protein